MIPADLASRLRTVSQELPTPVQPATPARQLPDVLSDLSAGQRIMAEIQALLPNGMYRAVVAQREITLALPFAAKAGDSLELEVVDNDGQLTLALAKGQISGKTPESQGESVPTTLSKTGSLIGNLLNEIDQQGGQAKPAPLNANHPITDRFPTTGSELAPILKEALTKSGMFYEAHQARWVEGKLTASNLLQEPQGKLSPGLLLPSTNTAMSSMPLAQAQHLAGEQPIQPTNSSGDGRTATGTPPGAENTAQHVRTTDAKSDGRNAISVDASRSSLNNDAPVASTPSSPSGSPIHPETSHLVQQQLNALATQTYAWQGQIWPGQNMQWEIAEDGHRQSDQPETETQRWRTRLRLSLPQLGGIDAQMRIDSQNQLQITISTSSSESRNKLLVAAGELNHALQAAGLNLSGFSVTHDEPAGRENS